MATNAGVVEGADVLYFDGRCPLCRREVALLARLSRPTLAFSDIHAARGEDLPSRDTLLRSLHLRRANGEMLTGLAANVAVWQHTPYGLPWRMLTLPGIRVVTNWLYERWAGRRYRRLYGCGLDQCV